jgi:hypothetical protein
MHDTHTQGFVRGSLAVRWCGGAGEYINGKNLHSLSLYLNG